MGYIKTKLKTTFPHKDRNMGEGPAGKRRRLTGWEGDLERVGSESNQKYIYVCVFIFICKYICIFLYMYKIMKGQI